jgi:hypothetical protein
MTHPNITLLASEAHASDLRRAAAPRTARRRLPWADFAPSLSLLAGLTALIAIATSSV